MFADRALASRIDRAEARLSSGFAQSRRPDFRPLVAPVCGGLAVYAGPGSPMTKVIGLGFDAPLELAPLADVEREWRDRGEPVRIELSILADAGGPGVERTRLSTAGLRERYSAVRSRSIVPAVTAPDVVIETLNGDDVRLWTDIAVTAFLHPDGTGSVAEDAFSRDQLERELLDFAAVPGLQRYLARIDGEPVGEAAFRLDRDSGLAQLAGAGTLPAISRPRRADGASTAPPRRSRAAGCDLAVVTTAPGTRSQENVMRRGFAPLHPGDSGQKMGCRVTLSLIER